MNAEELLKMLKAKQAPIILDVRSGFEFNSGHIHGAVHAPLSNLLQRTALEVQDNSELIVVTCEHGPRAQLAKMLLKWRGYKNVELLEGHMANWRVYCHPVISKS